MRAARRATRNETVLDSTDARANQQSFVESLGQAGLRSHQELDRLRVNFAKGLLREFALKLQTVAAQCGFSNPRHFRRTFLRQTRQTPQQYRRDLKAAARANNWPAARKP